MSTLGAASRADDARITRVARGFVLPGLLLLSWLLVTHYRLVNPHLLVSPGQVIASFRASLLEGDLLLSLVASVERDLAGFAVGATAGLALGSLLGLSPLAERVFGPTFNAAKQVAVFAWLPLISVWFGTGERAKVVFIALAAFYPVVVNTLEGIRSVERVHVQVATVFRFSDWQVFRRVVWPAALPSIFAGLHLALVYAWLGTLGAEFLLESAPGIGNLMIDGREQFAMDKVLLGVIIVGFVGFALNAIATAAEARVVRWRVRGL